MPVTDYSSPVDWPVYPDRVRVLSDWRGRRTLNTGHRLETTPFRDREANIWFVRNWTVSVSGRRVRCIDRLLDY